MRRLTHALMLAAVPLYINYQSVLLDSGGNPIPSGPTELTFRITDSSHNALYEESQTIDSNKGVVTALIGNGNMPGSNAPATGLSADLFKPGESLYLEVSASGTAADDPLEIVSVPYSIWSQRVAEGGVDAKAIAAGAIGMGHFANGLVDELATSIIKSTPFAEFEKGLAAPGGAAQVGVNTTFIYSGATTVQGVLKDLDLAIKSREEKNVNKAGDILSGTLSFKNGARVTGLPPAQSDTDAATFSDLKKLTTVGGDLGGTINNMQIMPGTVGTNELATGSVTAEKIADGAITNAKIAGGTITGAQIADGSISAADIADGSVTAVKIADGTLGGTDVANASIGAEKLNFDVATQGELDQVKTSIPPPLPQVDLNSAVTMTSGVIDLSAWDEGKQNYVATIPDPDNKIGSCVYHAAFAGTPSGILTANIQGKEMAMEVKFEQQNNGVWCKVFSYKTDGSGTLSHFPCRISYITVCR